MSAFLGKILLGQFVRIDIVGFMRLTDRARQVHDVEQGMILEFRVILRIKATAAMKLALGTALTSGVALGGLSIKRLAHGGTYFNVVNMNGIGGFAIFLTYKVLPASLLASVRIGKC